MNNVQVYRIVRYLLLLTVLWIFNPWLSWSSFAKLFTNIKRQLPELCVLEDMFWRAAQAQISMTESSLAGLETFFSASLGGKKMEAHLPPEARWTVLMAVKKVHSAKKDRQTNLVSRSNWKLMLESFIHDQYTKFENHCWKKQTNKTLY